MAPHRIPITPPHQPKHLHKSCHSSHTWKKLKETTPATFPVSNKTNQKKNEVPFSCVQFVSPSVLFVLSLPNCLGLQGGQVQHGERSPDSPTPALGYPTPLEWKFCLETPRFTKPWSWKHGKSSHAKHGGFFSARKQHWTNVELFHVKKFGSKWKCLGFWKKETKLMTQVRWVNVAVYVFTCSRVVVSQNRLLVLAKKQPDIAEMIWVCLSTTFSLTFWHELSQFEFSRLLPSQKWTKSARIPTCLPQIPPTDPLLSPFPKAKNKNHITNVAWSEGRC